MKAKIRLPFRPEDNPALWLVPLSALLALVFVLPCAEIVRLSFTSAGFPAGSSEFSLRSYSALFSDTAFIKMLGTTLLFVFLSAAFQVGLGFLLALYTDYGVAKGYRGTMLVRAAVLAAWAVPGVVIGIIWRMMYSELDSGIITGILKAFFPDIRPVFLSDPKNALVCAVVANIWRGTAYSMILLYAGLRTFPAEIIEAAKIDRANALQRFFLIVVPVLLPIILISTILVTVQTFNTFDMLMSLTGGGPGRSTEVIALNIYRTIFFDLDLGKGAAAALTLLLINIVMTLIYFRYESKAKG